MLHNTICGSVIDHINEKRLTLLSTHNAPQCITIRAQSTNEFHNPFQRSNIIILRNWCRLLVYGAVVLFHWHIFYCYIDVVCWQLLLIHKTAQCIIHHNYIPQLIQRINVTSASSCVFNQTMRRQRCQLSISEQTTNCHRSFLQIYSVSLGVQTIILYLVIGVRSVALYWKS